MEPMGFFDPAGFAKDKDEAGFKKLRSAEIRHGRAAMMGALGLAVQSVYKLPGFEDVPAGLGAQWTEPGKSTLVAIVAFIGCLEAGILPWKEDPEKPGDYGDPLNLGDYSEAMRNKEINNGRIAMFSVLGIVSAEIYTSKIGVGQFAIAQSKLAVVPSSFCGASLAGGSCASVA